LAARVRTRLLDQVKREESSADHGKDELAPLTLLVLGVTRQLTLLGFANGDIPAELANWINLVLQDQVDKLRQHDYDAFRRALSLIRMYVMASGDTASGDSNYQKVIALLKFRATLDFTITGGQGNLSETAKVDGLAKLSDQSINLTDPSPSAMYTGGSVEIKSGGNATKVTPDSWSTQMTVSYPDTCNGVIGVELSPWGKGSEEWSYKGYTIGAYVGDFSTLLNSCVQEAFAAGLAQNQLLYGYPMISSQLHNKDAVAADDSHNGSCHGYQIKLQLHIEHAV
jgi:hypothetical protein